jgi:uncharacterized membrane protein
MSRRGLLIALVASLAINLFAIGAVVGAIVLGPRIHGPAMRGGGGPPFWSAAAELPPERRAAYRRALLGEAGEVRAALRAARHARREAWLSLGDPTFAPQEATVRLERARVLEMQARSVVERRIVDFAATLSPQERAHLAKGLARSRPGHHRPRRPPQP